MDTLSWLALLWIFVLYVLPSALFLGVLYFVIKGAVRRANIQSTRSMRQEDRIEAERTARRQSGGWERARRIGGTSWRA